MTDEEDNIVVCCRDGTPRNYTDDEEGDCFRCGHAIFWRPHNPPGRHICIDCLPNFLEEQLEPFVTGKVSVKTLEEVIDHWTAELEAKKSTKH